MRRYEIEYRLTRARTAEQHFLDEIKHFNQLFEAVDGAPSMREKLNQQVQTYNYTFAQRVASTDNIQPLLSLISHDTQSLIPEAENIRNVARISSSTAASALELGAHTKPSLHHRHRLRRHIARTGLQLRHRPIDHPAAGGTCRCDDAARRRRHHVPHSGDGRSR